jgi:penicillin-binding protein 2
VSAFHPHLLERRLRVGRAVVWTAGAALVIVFFRTQILEHSKYQLQSETNRLRPIPLPAPRGIITDRNGKILAENVTGYTVSLLPAADEDSLLATLRRIAPIVKLDNAAIERVLVRYRRTPYLPVSVLPNATFEVVSALEERRLIFPGLLIQPEPKRHYPDSSLVAHLVGYVGELTETERAQRRFAAVRLGGLLGKGGLERQYDDSLRGADGVRFVEVSALGQVVREAGPGSRLSPIPGRALHTTIDLELQRYIAQIFPAGQRGAVLALNPNSGEILALYSAPGFDPNAFVGGVDPDYWRRLNVSEAHPLFDRTIQARYPPGSTWKLALAAMALKRGIVTLRSRMPIPCRGGLQYGNRFFRCWSAKGHGDLVLADAIAQSCDVYFYQLGLKLGLTSLLEDATGLGFHARTGIDLPGEITSEFPGGTDYYDRVYGPRRWTSAVTLNLAIGQGENAQTLVNMVRFYQMLASDGRARPPYLVHPSAGSTASLALTPEQLAGLRQAMISVVERGTARGAGRFGGSISIAGKTGTAQNPHGPAHGWFIGFAPAEKPEIVVGAIVEFAREGPYVAPLVTRVIGHYLGVDTTLASKVRIVLPTDTAPHPVQILPGAPGEDTTVTPLDTETTIPPDSGPPPPPDVSPPPPDAAAAPRDR